MNLKTKLRKNRDRKRRRKDEGAYKRAHRKYRLEEGRKTEIINAAARDLARIELEQRGLTRKEIKRAMWLMEN